MNAVQGTIVIRPKFILLSFLLNFFKPKASINGHVVPLRWRVQNAVPVPAGRYEVAVWCPYVFRPRMGYSAVIVDVAPGAAVEVTWKSPWLVFLAGRIRVQPIDPRLVQGQAQPVLPQYAQAQYPQAQYGQAQYGQAQYGQAQTQYAQAQYGQAQAHYAQAQAPAQAVGGAGAGWQPDPSGRHQYRWWDGASWASDVSDGGVTSHDQL